MKTLMQIMIMEVVGGAQAVTCILCFSGVDAADADVDADDADDADDAEVDADGETRARAVQSRHLRRTTSINL